MVSFRAALQLVQATDALLKKDDPTMPPAVPPPPMPPMPATPALEVPAHAPVERCAVYDKLDGTYHIGDGEWSREKTLALSYASRAAAERAIEEDLDPAEILREQLCVVPHPNSQEREAP